MASTGVCCLENNSTGETGCSTRVSKETPAPRNQSNTQPGLTTKRSKSLSRGRTGPLERAWAEPTTLSSRAAASLPSQPWEAAGGLTTLPRALLGSFLSQSHQGSGLCPLGEMIFHHPSRSPIDSRTSKLPLPCLAQPISYTPGQLITISYRFF